MKKGWNQGFVPDTLEGVTTLPELLAWRVDASPLADAYRYHSDEDGQWHTLSWQDVAERVEQWRNALRMQNFAAGSRIAILMPNGVDHVCLDQAALSLGFVPVPMHAVDHPDSVAYILQDSDASLLLIDRLDRWQAIAAVGTAWPQLQRVVVAQADLQPPSDDRVLSLQAWLGAGRAWAAKQAALEPPPRLAPSSMAALVYTSGTTGRPKGVMLSHRNIVANILAVLKRYALSQHDSLLSFLPLSHTFERTVGYYLPMAVGACVAHARSVALLQEDLQTVRPTVLVSVPRIYERIYAKVQEAMNERGPVGRTLLAWAEEVGWHRFLAVQEHAELGTAERLAWQVLRPWVAQRVLETFGGNVRLAISGGAPLSSNVAHFFLGLGLNLLQGYGMTETSPVVSSNLPDDNDPLSVGRALPDVQLRIEPGGELLVAGPNVMLGYWKREADTRKVLDPDGWLHTGDLARLDQGRLYIVGRLKDIIVTSTGEKVPPADLELAIQADPLFAQVLVIGEQKPYIAVLAVLNPVVWAREAQALGLDATLPESLQSEAALRVALARANEQAKTFPSYAAPKRIWLTLQPWTIEAGLMTPTLKLKRAALEQRFAPQIADLYSHH